MKLGLQGQSVDGKPETQPVVTQRLSSCPRRSASSSGSGEGRCGQGGAWSGAPPRVPERGWYGVWLGPLHGLESEPGEYVRPGVNYISIVTFLRGGGVKDRLWSREEARDEQPSQSGKKLGPLLGLKLAGVGARSPGRPRYSPATKPGNREKLFIRVLKCPLTAAGYCRSPGSCSPEPGLSFIAVVHRNKLLRAGGCRFLSVSGWDGAQPCGCWGERAKVEVKTVFPVTSALQFALEVLVTNWWVNVEMDVS